MRPSAMARTCWPGLPICASASPEWTFACRRPRSCRPTASMCEVLYETALRFAASDAEPRRGPLLRHRLAQPPARAGLTGGPGHRDPGGGRRGGARQCGARRHRQRLLLRRRRAAAAPLSSAPGARRRPARRRRPAGGRGHRSAASGDGAQGPAARGGARRRPLRLRLVQPDDARRQRGGTRRARVPARQGRSGRHVPAHAPHRDGSALRARRPPAAG